jgi:hypothetical protein
MSMVMRRWSSRVRPWRLASCFGAADKVEDRRGLAPIDLRVLPTLLPTQTNSELGSLVKGERLLLERRRADTALAIE